MLSTPSKFSDLTMLIITSLILFSFGLYSLSISNKYDCDKGIFLNLDKILEKDNFDDSLEEEEKEEKNVKSKITYYDVGNYLRTLPEYNSLTPAEYQSLFTYYSRNQDLLPNYITKDKIIDPRYTSSYKEPSKEESSKEEPSKKKPLIPKNINKKYIPFSREEPLGPGGLPPRSLSDVGKCVMENSDLEDIDRCINDKLNGEAICMEGNLLVFSIISILVSLLMLIYAFYKMML